MDGVIREDRLGLDLIYVQAKRWKNVVGRPEIQKFFGALHGQRATKGVFITMSNFSREAVQYADGVSPRRRHIHGCADVGTTTTFATRLAASGQPMRTIQEFLGHADSKTTQIYAHYAPSAHEVEMVNAAFAEEEPTARDLAGVDPAA